MSLLDPPAEVLAAIDELRPDVISSYGSYLEVLFQHAYRQGIELDWPRVAVYHSDALAAPARRLIEEHFGIEVLTFYSAVEAATIGFECERHMGLHLNCDLNPVRIVGDDGEELPDGERGRGGRLQPRQSRHRVAQLPARRRGGEASRSLPMRTLAPPALVSRRTGRRLDQRPATAKRSIRRQFAPCSPRKSMSGATRSCSAPCPISRSRWLRRLSATVPAFRAGWRGASPPGSETIRRSRCHSSIRSPAPERGRFAP